MSTSMKETFIHPTALVEPGVELGQGVSVGPFVTFSPAPSSAIILN